MENDRARKSSKKSKSSGSNSADQRKQPQRGLGVARLEKIRLQNEMVARNPYLASSVHAIPFTNPLQHEALAAAAGYGPMQRPPMHPPLFTFRPPVQSSPSSHTYHPNMMVGMGDLDRTNIICSPDNPQTPRRNPSFGVSESQQPYVQPGMTTRPSVKPNNSVQVSMYPIDPSTQSRRRNDAHEVAESSGRDPAGSNGNDEDLDLELKL